MSKTFEELLDTYINAHEDMSNYPFRDNEYSGLEADAAAARLAVIKAARPEVDARNAVIEECAKVCDDYTVPGLIPGVTGPWNHCAKAIRALKRNQPQK